MEVKYGVQQGSLLGPGLQMTDDTHDVIVKLNCLFKDICTWCRLNKLSLHSGKTEVIIMQRDQFSCGPTVACEVWGYTNQLHNQKTICGFGHQQQNDMERSVGDDT